MNNKLFKFIYKTSIVLAATIAAILIGAIVLKAIGKNPMATYRTIFMDPLLVSHVNEYGKLVIDSFNQFGATEILVRAVPLIFVALGIAISFRSGILNIGAEGQMQMGVIAATAVAVYMPSQSKLVLVLFSLCAGATAGAIWAGIAGWLRARLGVNEILSTVMLNYIAAQVYSFIIRGPMIDPSELETGSGTPQSVRLVEAAWLGRIFPGTRIHMGLIIALVMCVFVYFLLWRTTYGYRMRAAGAEAKAARFAGIAVERYLIVAMLFAGGFAGLAGGVEVLGLHHRAIEGITSGYGFVGIVVALFGALHPAGIVPSSIFFGLLLVGSDMTQRSAGVPANMVLVLEGAVILAIVSAKMYMNNPYTQDRMAKFFARFKSKAPEPVNQGGQQ